MCELSSLLEAPVYIQPILCTAVGLNYSTYGSACKPSECHWRYLDLQHCKLMYHRQVMATVLLLFRGPGRKNIFKVSITQSFETKQPDLKTYNIVYKQLYSFSLVENFISQGERKDIRGGTRTKPNLVRSYSLSFLCLPSVELLLMYLGH